MKFAKFMASPAGRLLRIAAGAGLIAWAIVLGGAAGIALGVVGAVPLLAGVFNVCLFAPLLRVPFSGRKVLTS